jgi:hypothetical protein
MTRATKLLPLTEAAFQRTVIECAKLHGWLVHHTRPGRTAKGWRTPIQGDAGFPDLVLCHPRRGLILLVELKTDCGRLTAEQERWRLALSRCVWWATWRPRDWKWIEGVLRGEFRTP